MKLLLDFYNLSLHKGPRQVFNTIYDSIQHSFSEFKKMHVDSLYYNSYNKDIVSSLIDGKYVGVSNLLHYISNCRGYYKISANYKHRSITMYFCYFKKGRFKYRHNILFDNYTFIYYFYKQNVFL